MKSRGKPLFGFFLIAIGALFLVDTLDLVKTNVVSYIWPILLIVLGGSAFMRGRRANAGSWFVLTLGVILLIGNISDEVDFSELWPVLIIVLGINAVVGYSRKRRKL